MEPRPKRARLMPPMEHVGVEPVYQSIPFYSRPEPIPEHPPEPKRKPNRPVQPESIGASDSTTTDQEEPMDESTNNNNNVEVPAAKPVPEPSLTSDDADVEMTDDDISTPELDGNSSDCSRCPANSFCRRDFPKISDAMHDGKLNRHVRRSSLVLSSDDSLGSLSSARCSPDLNQYITHDRFDRSSGGDMPSTHESTQILSVFITATKEPQSSMDLRMLNESE